MSEKIAELKDRLSEALDLRGKKSRDLVADLDIPASAISQYLIGKSKNMSAERLGAICEYLDVSEPWMMGYDVTRERITEEKNNAIADAVVRMRRSPEYFEFVQLGLSIDDTAFAVVNKMLSAFLEQPNN